jgi:hypothetical protein
MREVFPGHRKEQRGQPLGLGRFATSFKKFVREISRIAARAITATILF